MKPVNQLLEKITIRHVLLLALVVRLLAVFFSPGYAFHDDHFEMPELVFRWKQGINFLWTGSDVHVFSLIYPGFMYGVFEACEAMGITSPEGKMFVIRLIHALFSLLTVYYSYLLALRLKADRTTAILVSLAMALFWIFPFMSVRNLREFFCIPFLVMGTYYLCDARLRLSNIILAAFFFAVSFSIRLQIIFIPAGMGLFMLTNRKTLRSGLIFGVSFLGAYMLTQGLFDLLYYNDPFANIKEYARFNSQTVNIEVQPQGPWFQYIGTVAGVVLGIPFILLAIGYVYSWRASFQSKMLLIGTLLFFAFHSYYSNKQERFILPFIPYFLLLGIIGFREYYHQHTSKKWLRMLVRVTLAWVLIFNTAGLLVLTFTYSKRSRVESMIYLRKKGDVTNVIMEGEVSLQRPPTFYLDKHLENFVLPQGVDPDTLKREMQLGLKPEPNYIIMAGEQNMDDRIRRIQQVFPGMRKDTVIRTSFVDNLAYWLNPKHNQNENWHIYKLK